MKILSGQFSGSVTNDNVHRSLLKDMSNKILSAEKEGYRLIDGNCNITSVLLNSNCIEMTYTIIMIKN